MKEQPIRCAIYTRKSSEEGLEQEFNSLDAQRLAAESYIASQKHEGWVLLPEYYDDGGYSGGNMERPGLKRLFADIRAGKIDCIVVYKIDRLTRSLVDFSKIIELFDEHQVSFVSVTQSFNTSNSMGRVQDTFKRADRPRAVGTRVTSIPLLKGLMTCGQCGGRIIPTYTNKKGKRYRYYICERKHKGKNDECSIGRMSAGAIEEAVVTQVTKILKRPEIVVQTITATAGKIAETDVIQAMQSVDLVWNELFPIEQARIINLLIKEVVVTTQGLDIRIYKEGLNSLIQDLEIT